VKTLNAVKQKLAQALADKDTPPFLYDDLKREHLMRTGSVVFHELYFGNLGGNGTADAELRKQIGAAFGDFDAWETEFRRVGAGLGGGSGWVVLGYNLHYGQIEKLLAGRPPARARRDFAAARDGHVRAFVPDGLWGGRGQIHRCILPEHPLGIRCGATRPRPARSLGEAIMKWVTRERPKIDRIACPWLIARFIDKNRNSCTCRRPRCSRLRSAPVQYPTTIPGAELSHVGELCSFDAFLARYELQDPRCTRWRDRPRRGHFAARTHAASAGLYAISLGLSVQLCRRPRDAAVWADPV